MNMSHIMVYIHLTFFSLHLMYMCLSSAEPEIVGPKSGRSQ